jgi:diadenosine tetraphosphatase ApaH/serine/threonine PP2A family protein phosphatase
MGWFPRPARAEDVSLIEGGGLWTRADLFALLTDPLAVEWRHKVGVAGPLDGSAKPTTRLMASRGWVCKTRVDEAADTADEARDRATAARRLGLAAEVWHPLKVWGVLRRPEDGRWLPVTVCPALVTLRQLEGLEERRRAWIEMLQASVDVHRAHGLGLDVNPANFARAPSGAGRLFYLDDEFYDAVDERNLAGAIAARIPEEPGATPAGWAAWGAALVGRLDLGAFTWERVRDEVRAYPLPERFEAHRAALVAALPDGGPRARRAPPKGPPKLTCVLADVHANRPALDAVLADARARGADSYLFLGDAVGYGPHPADCVARLAELEAATFVRGNHDHAIATGAFEVGMNRLARRSAQWTRSSLGEADLAWLGALPLDQVGDGWVAVHGAPKDPHRFLAYVYELTYEDNLRYLRREGIPLCFYGHTHVQMTHAELAAGAIKLPGARTIEIDRKRRYLVNPGSVGQPRDGDPRAGYALWNRATDQIATLRVGYDVERTIEALRAAALPEELEPRLRAGT